MRGEGKGGENEEESGREERMRGGGRGGENERRGEGRRE